MAVVVAIVLAWVLVLGLPRAIPVSLRFAQPEDRVLLVTGILGLGAWFSAWMLGEIVVPTTVPDLLSILLITVVAATAVVTLWRSQRAPRREWAKWVRGVAPGWLLFAGAALLTLGLGLLWASGQALYDIAESRFIPLPPDERIPVLFAEGLRQGSVPSPLLGDWYSADRPPLQTGIDLLLGEPAIRLAGVPTTDAYLTVGIVSQLLLALMVFRVGRTIGGGVQVGAIAATATVLLGATGTYVFFAWPKMLAGAFLILAFALLVDSRRNPGQTPYLAIGIVISLGLLAHGGALFAAVPLLVWAAARIARSGGARKIATRCAQLAAGVLGPYAPWVAYGRITGEDHQRLVKWHFAGVIEPTTTSAVETLRAAYSGLTFGEWLAGRIDNVKAIAFVGAAGRDSLNAWVSEPDRPTTHRNAFYSLASVGEWRTLEFYVPLFSMWASILWVIPVAVLLALPRWRRSQSGKPFAVAAAVWVTATILIWCLLMFMPGSVLPHQGSVITFVLPVAVLAMMVAARSTVAALMVLGAQAVFFAYAMIPPVGVRYEDVPSLQPASGALLVTIGGGLTTVFALVASIRLAVPAEGRSRPRTAPGSLQ